MKNLFLLACIAGSLTLKAQEPVVEEKPEKSVPSDVFSIETHGFVSQGFFITTDNHFLSKNSEEGSFEFSEIGINFTKQISDRLRIGLQLFARKLGPVGNFNAKMDWFYIDYRWRDWFGIRAGRIKVPFGLYNEIHDVDSARVPVLLPQSVYPIQNRDFLLAQSGGEVYGYINLENAGAIDYRAYVGTLYVDLANRPGNSILVQDLRVPFLAGGRLLWETPLEGLRAGGSLQFLRLDADLVYDASIFTPLQTAGLLPPAFDGKVSGEAPALLWVASAEYSGKKWLTAAEYSRWHIDVENSSQPALLPNNSTTSERAYLLSTYRVNSWLQPGMYYSVMFPDVRHRTGRANMHHDIAATLRFDLNDYWLLKLEGHYFIGTAGLDSQLNNNIAQNALDKHWGAFFIKTTAHF